MLLPFLAFVVGTDIDTFSDQRSHYAMVGNPESGPSLVITCEAARRRPNWTIRITPGQPVEAEAFEHGLMAIRYDAQPATDMVVRYDFESVIIEGTDAASMVASLEAAERVAFGLRGGQAQRIDMIIPLDGAVEALGELRGKCTPAR